MSKRLKTNNVSGDFSNQPIQEENEDTLPNKKPNIDDSYEEEFDDSSVKGNYNAPVGIKSPSYNKNNNSKMFKNSSMGSLQSSSKFFKAYLV